MSEPTPNPSAEAGSPFAPERAAAPSGCAKPFLVGCGVLTIILGLGAIVFVFKAKDLFSWMMGKVRNEVVAAMPADATGEDRDAFQSAFDGALSALNQGKADPEALRALQSQLMMASEKAPAKTLTLDDLHALTAALRKVAGEPPAGAPEAAPADASPTPSTPPGDPPATGPPPAPPGR
ncbi:MAG: hypothetical protein U0X73_03185 [Thermoanaerobaculia bacterium]